CHVHAGIRPSDVAYWQREAPEADLLVHPECGCASQALAFANESAKILATEEGILHRLRREAPGKRFEPVRDGAVCRFMKMITLEKLRDALRDGVHEVTVDPEVAARARGAIDRMVALG